MHVVPHFLKPVLHEHSVPAPLQVEFGGQVPQFPLQPSGPQTLPWQFGTQTQMPCALHVWPCGQQTPRQHWVVQFGPVVPLIGV